MECLTKERRAELERYYFWNFVNVEPNTGCWIWTGATYSDGYGQVGFDKLRMAAHRAMYLFRHGSLPKNCCHKCDVRLCVNPAHIFPGSQLDNMRDCAVKGRTSKTKVPNDAVLEALRFYRETPLTLPKIERHLGLPRRYLEDVIYRGSRRTVTGPIRLRSGAMAQWVAKFDQPIR